MKYLWVSFTHELCTLKSESILIGYLLFELIWALSQIFKRYYLIFHGHIKMNTLAINNLVCTWNWWNHFENFNFYATDICHLPGHLNITHLVLGMSESEPPKHRHPWHWVLNQWEIKKIVLGINTVKSPIPSLLLL